MDFDITSLTGGATKGQWLDVLGMSDRQKRYNIVLAGQLSQLKSAAMKNKNERLKKFEVLPSRGAIQHKILLEKKDDKMRKLSSR